MLLNCCINSNTRTETQQVFLVTTVSERLKHVIFQRKDSKLCLIRDIQPLSHCLSEEKADLANTNSLQNSTNIFKTCYNSKRKRSETVFIFTEHPFLLILLPSRHKQTNPTPRQNPKNWRSTGKNRKQVR